MNNKRLYVMIMLVLVIAMLACNFPGFAGSGATVIPDGDTPPQVGDADADDPSSTSGEDLPDEEPTEAATDDDPVDTDAPDSLKPTNTPTETTTPTITPTPTETQTPTPTITPELGDPLSFEDPAWEWVEWQQIADTGDIEGVLVAHIEGGVAPYRVQLDDRDQPVTGLKVTFRWRLCADMPATLKVWSADGQYVQTGIWVWKVGCP